MIQPYHIPQTLLPPLSSLLRSYNTSSALPYPYETSWSPPGPSGLGAFTLVTFIPPREVQLHGGTGKNKTINVGKRGVKMAKT